jgi:uncharacterized OB-fold protein
MLKIGDEVEMVFRKIKTEGEEGVISYGTNSNSKNKLVFYS